MSSEALPLMVDADVRARLEKLAADTGRSVSELADGVLRRFIDDNERFVAEVQVGLAEADAGMFVDYDEFKADIEAQLARLAAKE